MKQHTHSYFIRSFSAANKVIIMLNFTGMYACKMKMEVKAVFSTPIIRVCNFLLSRPYFVSMASVHCKPTIASFSGRELSRSNRGWNYCIMLLDRTYTALIRQLFHFLTIMKGNKRNSKIWIGLISPCQTHHNIRSTKDLKYYNHTWKHCSVITNVVCTAFSRVVSSIFSWSVNTGHLSLSLSIYLPTYLPTYLPSALGHTTHYFYIGVNLSRHWEFIFTTLKNVHNPMVPCI